MGVGGNEYLLLDSSVNHRKDDLALNVEDLKIVVKDKGTIRKSTVGQDICASGRIAPHHGKVIDLNPIQVAKYAISQNINMN